MCKYVFANEASLEVYAEELSENQHYIHAIADRALNSLGIKTAYNPDELSSFSQGFAGFEAISDVVRNDNKPYDTSRAGRFVAEFLVDTRNIQTIENERKTHSPVIEGQYDDYIYDPVTDLLIPNINGGWNATVEPVTHDKADPELTFTAYHNLLAELYPNTYDVIVAMGEKRDTSMAQLHMRTAGAQLARNLQVED